ncbi:hypothetical protein KFL_002320220 [Klebsormidium nitens]|uniref:C2H2-type domain-containing protein n=1 Tax=Klebsormidium nitens TaxID=105231 RepID=A0A1Y1IBB4_KLENI|nr:hypothetical protein KFL_002320220 [Klebsormidium nitens]|eukprot:GAQ85388.1 hypothetical protein KFL_002320220 [Klebsormidium nitens]
MARGKQKIESQKKNAEKNAPAKGSQLKAQAEALKVQCPICKAPFTSYKNLVVHYESKHPKETPPPAP